MRGAVTATGRCCAAAGPVYGLHRHHGRGPSQQRQGTRTGKRGRLKDHTERRRWRRRGIHSGPVVWDGLSGGGFEGGRRATSTATISGGARRTAMREAGAEMS